MKQLLITGAGIVILASCNTKTVEKKFEVKGTLTNCSNKMIYLEEIPMTTMQRTVVDSARLEKDGKYSLHAGTGEATVYNLRLDQNPYPLAAVINDAPSVTVNAGFSKENNQFSESYDVKGSPASQQMKDFMVSFNTRLQAIFFNAREEDSLKKNQGADSLLTSLRAKTAKVAQEINELFHQSLAKSDNPALSMFILGYYQSIANNPGYQLEPIDKSEVIQIVDDATAKFPQHQGLASIKASLQGWVGKMAPEIALPDPNGKEVKLSSFRGKYVLVDFWASWCKPCRMENPTVVKAFNKYKEKNFTVLGVSLDQPGQKDAWMKAVMQDGLSWTQVSDLKYWDSEIVPLYKIDGIPYNVLVDPSGRIIAEALRGEDLEKKLAEVLK